MSTNPNKYQKNSYFMSLALQQAHKSLGNTGTNPSVGCILVKNNHVISAGFTGLNGRPHAEHNAINLSKKNVKGSELYVTLEPCSHYGKTPPCVNTIIKSGVKQVFFSSKDPDLRSYNKSTELFKKNKIVTKNGILYLDIRNFYKSYIKYKENLLPFVTAKMAVSKDFYTIDRKKKWITNIYSRRRSHLIRSMYDCVISTSKSINDDNSLLDCRIEGLEKKSPDLIILDRNLKLKKKLKLFKTIKNRKILLFTSSKNKKKILYLKKIGIKVNKINSLKNKNDFKNLFLILKKKGYSRIFVESGITFLNFLIKNKFLKNIYVFKSDNSLKKFGTNYFSSNIIKQITLKNPITVNLFGDKLYKERLK